MERVHTDMNRNAYRPSTLKEAISCLNKTKGILYAGGTELMVRNIRWGGVPLPSLHDVIFVGHLDELKRIDIDDGCLRIGACANLADVRLHPSTPAVLKKIVGEMASPAVRRLATIGGNICNASPAADTLPYLYAVDARVVCESLHGQREIALDRFISGPGKTDLGADEILTSVIIPGNVFTHQFYRKVSARRANSLSKVSFVGLAKKEGKRLTDIRCAFGAVGPTVVRSCRIERTAVAALSAPSPSAVKRLVTEYSGQIRPIDDQRSTSVYRRDVALRLLENYLQSLL
jgi:xanthine dehydrogenase FAD-binding subunit